MDRCPSCDVEVSVDSNFCNECGYNFFAGRVKQNRSQAPEKSYRLRSPMLDSDLMYEETKPKQFGFLGMSSYGFWLFSIAFVIFGVRIIMNTYTVDLLAGIIEATNLFLLAFVTFLLPWIVKLFIALEEHLSQICNELQHDKKE